MSQAMERIRYEWSVYTECPVRMGECGREQLCKGYQGLSGGGQSGILPASQLFVGENGSGKSTLLEAMAVNHGFNPEGGTKNYIFSTYDEYPELCDAIRVSKGCRREKWGYFLRAESFYNVATQEEQYADIAHPSAEYHKQSHGESFLALVHDNFGANGLYLLDEPEAALSPQRQLTLLWEIVRCVKEGSQFIIATHSPILLGIPDADICCFDKGPVHRCSYEETASYQITELFINHREEVLKNLLVNQN